MNCKIEEIIIAACLHDVGKFAQRADIKELYNEKFENYCCKHHKGGWYTHQHAVYTEGFLEKYKNILPDGVDVNLIRDLAGHHHNPSTPEEWIIAVADRLSSGSDRCNILNDENDSSNKFADESKLKFYEKPMVHLLTTLHLEGKEKSQLAYCKMKALDKDSILATTDKKISKEDYKKLWEEFENDFVNLQGLDFEQFEKSLLTLLERYWWCIPSATNVDSDVSLFQHAKTTAAFSSALYRYYEKEEHLDEFKINDSKDKKFLFVNGDISGIQKYIFDLKSASDSAKLLRSKSFELWALSEILSELICKEFGVTNANIVTSAGGKFILLLPNCKNSKEKLAKIQTNVEEYFIKEFAGKLAVIISDGVEANTEDLNQNNAKDLFNKIGTECDRAKQKKMQKGISKCGAVLDSFYDDLQKNGECPKCGVFAKNLKNEDEECDNCKKLIEIGKDLTKKSVVKLDSTGLKHFGQMVKLYKDESHKNENVYSINKYKPGLPLLFLPYVAPWKNETELKTFAEIAEESNGNKKLAMFKADIDNLGLVFATSLGKRISISRYADLSFMLHYFFSAFYAWFVENHQNPDGVYYSEVIYTVFSGGDDLCVIGAWDSILYFARDFQKALCEFTNYNPSVTISGGISLCSANIPVNVIAQMSEENLEKSKEYKNGGKLKNAITVFDTTVNWEEYSACLKDGEWLDSLVEKDEKGQQTVSTGVIYKMIDFSNRAKSVQKGNIKDLLSMKDIKNKTWKSHFYYIISRNVKDETIRKKLLRFAENDEQMIKSKIAVSYALYKNRKN